MSIPHLAPQGPKTILKVHDKPFVALAGEVHNSDSSSLSYMEGIWDIAERLHMNTLLLPVSWEIVEPEEDVFDFALVKGLIDQARQRDEKIIFLWFGSWKNAECMYAPGWVKKDRVRFPRGQIVKGKDKTARKYTPEMDVAIPYATLSYLGTETMKADAKAFANLMAFIKEYDEEENTVIMVQVENETGLLGNSREVSDLADEYFERDVPEDFLSYLKAHTETMVPDVKEAVEKAPEKGNWKEVFGDIADEIFSAYYVSGYVESVAKAGKEVYPLPMSANCWLEGGKQPGYYPSGGPVSRVHEVWKYRAPSIDLLTPDIYLPAFHEICEEYTRRGTPLMIPECAVHSYCAPRLVYTIGHHHTIGYSPFGFDDIGKPFNTIQGVLFGMDVSDPALKTPQDFDEYAKTEELLGMLKDKIGEKLGSSDLQAACGEVADYMPLCFKDVVITAIFKSPIETRTNGYLLAVHEKEGEVYVMGNICMLQVGSIDPDHPNLDLLKVEEGVFDKEGNWVPGRRFNGDETAMMSFKTPSIWKIEYFTY